MGLSSLRPIFRTLSHPFSTDKREPSQSLPGSPLCPVLHVRSLGRPQSSPASMLTALRNSPDVMFSLLHHHDGSMDSALPLAAWKRADSGSSAASSASDILSRRQSCDSVSFHDKSASHDGIMPVRPRKPARTSYSCDGLLQGHDWTCQDT